MDITINNYELPKIQMNYDELKMELEKSLSEYKGIVVTEETLQSCKMAQKELASLRNKIDTRRKEIKKDYDKPLKEFEAQCKDLISLIGEAEQPIKEGITYFDNIRKEEKKQKALEIIEQVATEQGLNDKYKAKLQIVDKYCNLTATEKAVREDVEVRAFALKIEQDREIDRLNIINGVVKAENERLQKKLNIEMFQYFLDNEVETSEIIEMVRQRANLIYEAEHPQSEEPKEEDKEEPKEEVKEEPKAPLFKVVFEVIATREKQHELADFMKQHGIDYIVKGQELYEAIGDI